MISTVEKGDELEDKFYKYLLEQKSGGKLVYDLYPPELCNIRKKPRYHCSEREADVHFDIVIEVCREGSQSPHLYVVFECKNHEGAIEELYVNDFSSKLSRVFKHDAKGVFVVSSRLQSGAKNVAKNSGMGIVKYEEDGLDIVAERRGGAGIEQEFLKSQIFKSETPTKGLKFSAFYDGKFFSSLDQFLGCLDLSLPVDGKPKNDEASISIPYISKRDIENAANKNLEKINYKSGAVDIEKICAELSIDLHFTEQELMDGDGNRILGSANFDRRLIQINSHNNKKRERFTIGHEIGHFCLLHGKYLRSEKIIESDMLITEINNNAFNYERLEFQANNFASAILLPEKIFDKKIEEYRSLLDIRDRGHGHIFVDDQPGNLRDYIILLTELSAYFEVSKQAIEIKLKKKGVLADHRVRPESLTVPSILSEYKA